MLDLTLTDLALKGFNCGFSDGTYGNAVPYHNGTWFDKVTRWALASFEQAKAMDLTMTDPALKGFQGGFNDGTYGYAMPFNNGAYFGKMTRWALAPFGQGQVLDLAATDPDLEAASAMTPTATLCHMTTASTRWRAGP